jgi:hypothetical protein
MNVKLYKKMSRELTTLASASLTCTRSNTSCNDLESGFYVQQFMGYFVGLAYQGKDIVFRFIIEYYSSLMDFGP